MNFSFWRREVFLVSLLAIFACLAYANSLQSPFTFDDWYNIEENPAIRLTQINLDGVKNVVFATNYSSRRAVSRITFALNYYFHQYDVFGYHVVNTVIHILSGIFLYLFIKKTLNLPILRPTYKVNSLIPFIAVLIWLVHPIQIQSVTYIVQRMNSMASMFYVLSLYLYVVARLEVEVVKKYFLFAGCTLAGLLSLGSKEISATLPFFILLYEWYFFQDLNRQWMKRFFMLFIGFFIFIFALAIIYLGSQPFEAIMKIYEVRNFTLLQRLITEPRVVVFYISLLLYPHPSRLNLDHDFPISYSLFEPVTTFFSILIIIAMMVIGVCLAKKDRLVSFCILWFFGNLVIESTIIGLEIIFEHRVYLPSMMASLLIVILFSRYIKVLWIGITVSSMAVLLFSFWTYQRNETWNNNVSLWRDTVLKSPNKARPNTSLAKALIEAGDAEEGTIYCEKALRIGISTIKLDYKIADVYKLCANVYLVQEDFDQAIRYFSESIRLDPTKSEAYNNMGAAFLMKGEIEVAKSYFMQALKLNPNSIPAKKNLRVIALKLQGSDESQLKSGETLELVAPDPVTHYQLGTKLMKEGKLKKAIEQFKKALVIKPEYLQAMNDMALIYVSQQEYEKALPLYERMIDLQPHSYIAYYNMACLYAKQKAVDESVHWLKEAVGRGFKDWKFLENDDDLKNIRDTAYYKKLTGTSD